MLELPTERTVASDAHPLLAVPALLRWNGTSTSITGGHSRVLWAVLLAVCGLLSIYTSAATLVTYWVKDPLKSIGALVPLVSLVLILRVWRSLGWQMQGTWWGLLLLVATSAAVHLHDHAVFELVWGPVWSTALPPVSMVAFCYALGMVLYFGGVPLLRRAAFPVMLMWLVNLVPAFFTVHVDLPLQHASSLIARGFAHALGQHLSPDQLRLMFTPEFGMFIAPGCNGIRGAVAMGFLALVAGYLYRFRLRAWALVVVAAVLLGYVFNLVRLCCLVLYYIVALHVPWLQPRAEMGDYLLGAALFFIATVLLFTAIQRLSITGSLQLPPLEPVPPPSKPQMSTRQFALRCTVLAVVLGACGASYARGIVRLWRAPQEAVDPNLPGRFPAQIGPYHRVRMWNEYMLTGELVYYWADYALDADARRGHDAGRVPSAADQAGVPNLQGNDEAPVSVGISPVLGAHDTLMCHTARGEEWLWHGGLAFATADSAAGSPTSFSGSLYNDGNVQYLEATTLCSGGRCGQYEGEARHIGLIVSRSVLHDAFGDGPQVEPLLLRTSTSDTAMAPDLARAELTANLRNFLAEMNLVQFLRHYRPEVQ
jgi:exosortase J